MFCLQWIITELATYNFANVIVPIYETLGFEASIFILNQTEMSLVVCDAVSKALGKTIPILNYQKSIHRSYRLHFSGLINQKSNCPHLKTIAVIEPMTDELRAAASEHNIRVITFEELERIGRDAEHRPEHQPPKVRCLCPPKQLFHHLTLHFRRRTSPLYATHLALREHLKVLC